MCFAGWVKVWREIMFGPIFHDSVVAFVWLWCVLSANRKAKQAKTMEVPAGSFLTSRQNGAKFLKITEAQFRRATEHLEFHQIIAMKPTSNGTLISVCEWDTYGEEFFDDNQLIAGSAPDLRPKARHDLRSKKKEVRETAARSAFVRPSVEDVQAAIDELQYDLDAEAFVAFYDSNGWKVGKSPMKNWRAALRTWQKRREDEDRNGSRFRKPVQRVKTRAEIEAEEEAPFVWPALPE